MKTLLSLIATLPLLLSAFEVRPISWSPRIFIVENFLTHEECDQLIERARPELAPSRIVESNSTELGLSKDRSSEGMFFPTHSEDPLLKSIEERLATLSFLPRENAEGVQVLRYKKGGEYKPHYDYFDPATEGGAYYLSWGGQRIATMIMYLNTVEEGGETIFPKVGLKVKPVKGNAVLFFNCTPDGTEDPSTLHGGAPVLKGEKWIATKWIRARELL